MVFYTARKDPRMFEDFPQVHSSYVLQSGGLHRPNMSSNLRIDHEYESIPMYLTQCRACWIVPIIQSPVPWQKKKEHFLVYRLMNCPVQMEQ